MCIGLQSLRELCDVSLWVSPPGPSPSLSLPQPLALGPTIPKQPSPSSGACPTQSWHLWISGQLGRVRTGRLALHASRDAERDLIQGALIPFPLELNQNKREARAQAGLGHLALSRANGAPFGLCKWLWPGNSPPPLPIWDTFPSQASSGSCVLVWL